MNSPRVLSSIRTMPFPCRSHVSFPPSCKLPISLMFQGLDKANPRDAPQQRPAPLLHIPQPLHHLPGSATDQHPTNSD